MTVKTPLLVQTGIVQVARRFPFEALFSILLTIALLIKIPARGDDFHAVMVLVPGFPLFFTITILAEKRGWSFAGKSWARMIAAGLLVLYYMTISEAELGKDSLREVLIVFGVFAAAMDAPYLLRGDDLNEWKWWRAMIRAFGLGVIVAFSLCLGISAAMGGLEYLFDVDVASETYVSLWIIGFFLVAPFTFLATIPKISENEEGEFLYDKALRAVTSYILVPLTLLYLVILYVYTLQIVVNWEWPKGGVAGFIIGFLAVGFLAFLVLHPLKDKPLSKVEGLFFKIFFPLSIPLAFVLFASVARRVTEYGITEVRYLGFALAIWMVAVSFFLIFNKLRAIRVAWTSIAAIALLASFGPWSAFSISERSQINRLKKLLGDGGASLASSNRVEIKEIADYLRKTHGTDSLEKGLGDEARKLESMIPYDKGGDSGAKNDLGIDSGGQAVIVAISTSFDDKDKSVSGFDVYLPLELRTTSGYSQRKFKVFSDEWTAQIPFEAGSLVLESKGKVVASFDLKSFALQTMARKKITDHDSDPIIHYFMEPDEMIFDRQEGAVRARLYVSKMNLLKTGDHIRIHDVEGVVLIGVR